MPEVPEPIPEPMPEPIVMTIEEEIEACKRFNVALEGVNFETNSYMLTSEAEVVLQGVIANLDSFPNVEVEVQAHTDSSGSDAYNLDLSNSRAQSVMSYLITFGIDPSRLTSQGYGENRPVASNDTREGRAMNRRVQLEVTNLEVCN